MTSESTDSFLVTGGTGFVGSYVVKELLNHGKEVVAVSRTPGASSSSFLLYADLRDTWTIDAIDWGELPQFKCLIHCASQDGNALYKLKHGAEIGSSNIRMVLNILDLAVRRRIPKVVVISSAEVYRVDLEPPVSEDSALHFPADDEISGYILGKLMSERLASMYRSQFGLKVVMARPVNVYGAGDNLSHGRLIPQIIRKCASGEPIEIWGDPSRPRRFVHVEDVAAAIRCISEQEQYDAVNISCEESTSILQVIESVASKMGKSPKILYRDEVGGSRVIPVLDNSRLKSIIDFSFMPLELGLSRTVASYDKATDGWK